MLTYPPSRPDSELLERATRLAGHLARGSARFSSVQFHHHLAVSKEEGDALLRQLCFTKLIRFIPDTLIPTYEASRGR